MIDGLHSLTLITLIGVTLFRLTISVGLFVTKALHSNRYTYWNYLLQTVFYAVLLFAYTRGRKSYLFRILTIYLFPVVFGSVFLVFLFIIIILHISGGWMLVEATTLGTGTLNIGAVHTADAIVHFFTVVDFFIVLVAGYLYDARASIAHFLEYLNRHHDPSHCLAYRIYFYLSPAIPMFIYTLFFNPFKEYPTGKSPFLIAVLALIINLLVMIWLYAAMTRQRHHSDIFDSNHCSKISKNIKKSKNPRQINL